MKPVSGKDPTARCARYTRIDAERFSSEAGVSLIELIMVLVIIAIVATNISTQLQNIFANSLFPRYLTQSAFLAEEKTETILHDRSQGVAAATACATDASTDSPITSYTDFSRTASFSSNTCTVQVTRTTSGETYATYEFLLY